MATATKEWLADKALEHRQDQTPAERAISAFLLELGVKFEAQHVFDPYIVDYYVYEEFSESKIGWKGVVIELDGWHHHKPEFKAKDKARTFDLLRMNGGIKNVIRIYNDNALAYADCQHAKEDIEKLIYWAGKKQKSKALGCRLRPNKYSKCPM